MNRLMFQGSKDLPATELKSHYNTLPVKTGILTLSEKFLKSCRAVRGR